MTKLDRLLQKTKLNERGCWVWTASRDPKGYGQFNFGNQRLAHRASYILHKGDIPAGLIVRHSCDDPSCVNPDHLQLGTHADNMADRKERRTGRGSRNVGEKNWAAKLSKRKVQTIRKALARGVQGKTLAARYQVNQSLISRIKNGILWGGV